MKLTSPVFRHLEKIPRRFTADGANVSPLLRWSGAPAEAEEYALLCEDPDASGSSPFVHWIAYGISANTSMIPEGLAQIPEMEAPLLIRQGLNGSGQVGYTGPNPPAWQSSHRYIFRLFALNSSIALAPASNRAGFWDAISPHIISEVRLIGLYENPVRKKVAVGARIAGTALLGVGLAWAGRKRFLSKDY